MQHRYYESPRQEQVSEQAIRVAKTEVRTQFLRGAITAEVATEVLRHYGCYEAEIKEVLS